MSRELLVIDASAVVDVVSRQADRSWVVDQISDVAIAAPSHVRAEVFSALGRRFRAGEFSVAQTELSVQLLRQLEITEHPVAELLMGAWGRRDRIRLADALYVELAAQLDTLVVTTDRRLARATPFAVAPPDD